MPPRHRHAFVVSAVLLCLAQAATAEVSDQDAIAAQLGSALGSADFASKNCPNIAIDTSRIDELAKRARQTPEQLRKGEDYAEQRDVVVAMAKQHGNIMVCALLPQAHGGFARGMLQAR